MNGCELIQVKERNNIVNNLIKAVLGLTKYCSTTPILQSLGISSMDYTIGVNRHIDDISQMHLCYMQNCY